MSPRPRLLRALLALVVALAVGGTTVAAPASASDATLRTAIKKADKKSVRQMKKIAPPDASSPTFAQDYATFVEQYNGIIASYRKSVRKERGSTAKGRKARKLMISSITALQKGLTTTAEVLGRTPAGSDASAEDQELLEDTLEDVEDALKDNARAYKLLGMKAPKAPNLTPSSGTSA
ncbi:hypothetical protein ACVU7I_07825 [Patulibacter sp. S7RM1-6]